MSVIYTNHYAYLEENYASMMCSLRAEFTDLQWKVGYDNITSDGDKCYGLMDDSELCKDTDLHPYQIAFLYLLSSFYPFCKEVRNTGHGWVPVDQWIRQNVNRLRHHLSPVNDD